MVTLSPKNVRNFATASDLRLSELDVKQSDVEQVAGKPCVLRVNHFLWGIPAQGKVNANMGIVEKNKS
jgi:hypothetical protein